MLQHPNETEISEPVDEQFGEVIAARAEDVIKPLDAESQEFDFWEDLKDSLPPWLDEVVGFALFVFGILSFISLYFPSEAMVAVAWSDILINLFGDGSVFVAGALFGFGVLLWLPKIGIRLRFTALGLLALEVAFLSALAILHLSNSEIELRALARAGQGGGLVGWGLSYPFYLVIGRQPALALFMTVTALATVVAVGMKRRHVVGALESINRSMQAYSRQAMQPREQLAEKQTFRLYKQLAASTAYRTRIMRIRPNPENIPDEIRQRRLANGKSKVKPIQAPSASSDQAQDNIDASRNASDAETVTGPIHASPIDASELSPSNGHSQIENNGPDKTAELVAIPQDQPRPGDALGLPTTDLLRQTELLMPDEAEVSHNVALIENTLLEFDIEINVVDVQVGPTVTRYALQPHKADGSERIRMSKIASYSRDLSLALAAKRLRMETPVPGTNYMGIEVPNKRPGIVALRNVMESAAYAEQRKRSKSPLLIPLGRDVAGKPVSIDLAQMPHLLIAGTTGSGKSVCMAALASSLLMQSTPSRLRMIMLDPKMVELTRFKGIPHLLGPVETDHQRIIGVLRWCAREMDRRYKLLENQSVRHIDAYNTRQLAKGVVGKTLPYLVIMIDEIGDLMTSNPEETETSIARLAQMARAVGMHLVVATQRPSVDVITGLIKANFPSRIAFSVASGADSRVILDKTGAEHLLGKGDMLFLGAEAAGPTRVQGCYVTEDDVRAVVQHWQAWQKSQIDAGSRAPKRSAPWEHGLERRKLVADTDPMLEDVIALVAKSQEISASLIQRKLGLGYPRAARIMDLLEELGVVGEVAPGGRSRRIIIPRGEDPFNYIMERHKKSQPDS